MSDYIDLSGANTVAVSEPLNDVSAMTSKKNNVPAYGTLHGQLVESSLLVDDIILKNYLSRLTEFEIVPLEDSRKQISDIRLFKINEMVYQKDEYSTYKLASVFNSVQNLNCGIFIIANSNGKKTDFYMGVRSLDDQRTTKSLKNTLRNALIGQFPGVKTTDLLDNEAEQFLKDIPSKNIATVSCIAQNKDEQFNDNTHFIQGLEKFALAMQGQSYTAVVLAKSTSSEQLAETRRAYELIYTNLSPFANMQLSYGTNTAWNISEAFSNGTTAGTSHTTNQSTQTGTAHSTSTTQSKSETESDFTATLGKSIGSTLIMAASLITAPWTGRASLVAAGSLIAAQTGLNGINPKSFTEGSSSSENFTENRSETFGLSDSINESTSETYTQNKGLTSGSSDNMQLTMQNKTLINTLERIDQQLDRMNECESLGMWECAAYFLSDSQETTEMAAGTYKALMKGQKSGIETSGINFWGGSLVQRSSKNKNKLLYLREYITNFIHPVFEYRSHSSVLPVTASSLVSGNELAIQMGLPRKSVCGFPVIEHVAFGQEVVRYDSQKSSSTIMVGNVFSMGSKTETVVGLDRDSLAMHTFITGSTGSGKSNTVYHLLNQLQKFHNIPFMVIEPSKGEYKNLFGQFHNVSVYGTNPKKSKLLRINPFRFPSDIHVLEHLDRLVELFNVCFPMYAAMPVILKEAMEKAYVAVGWNIATSENHKGEVFPNFFDLLEQIEIVISESKYSADSKGDYAGALCTRIRSLTNGLNGQIFTNSDLTDAELFDKSVIVDLSRVGSTETKALIMGLLVMKLNEYRMTSGKMNHPLTHITVLEEAHHLLKRTSIEQSAESANLVGKSVELLANSIAEMRTYGEGFIIADQSPGLLDLSVIRNTNTKIILRLPEQSDRDLVGLSANLNQEQLVELSKLERGVAAIFQNDWIEPVLVKIHPCDINETPYHESDISTTKKVSLVWEQLLFLLLQGRICGSLPFDIDEIEHNLDALGLSTNHCEFVEEQIHEFRANSRLALWDENNFHKLSRRVVNLMGVRRQVENATVTAIDNHELTERLSVIVKSFVPNCTEQFTMIISQCFMKDLSLGEDEAEKRQKIYQQWVESLPERSTNL